MPCPYGLNTGDVTKIRALSNDTAMRHVDRDVDRPHGWSLAGFSRVSRRPFAAMPRLDLKTLIILR